MAEYEDNQVIHYTECQGCLKLKNYESPRRYVCEEGDKWYDRIKENRGNEYLIAPEWCIHPRIRTERLLTGK